MIVTNLAGMPQKHFKIIQIALRIFQSTMSRDHSMCCAQIITGSWVELLLCYRLPVVTTGYLCVERCIMLLV